MKEIIEIIKRKNSFQDVDIIEFAPSDAWAETIARSLKDKMKTTQLRKVFASIKQMELKAKARKDEDIFNDSKIYMMLPHLAYAKARKFINDDFYSLMKVIIGNGTSGKIKHVGDFKRFVEFMTAIVAYHKQPNK